MSSVQRFPTPDLYRALQRLLGQVPCGRVSTYGDLAEGLGALSASRWIGGVLGQHEHDEQCACHRIIRRTGELGAGTPEAIFEKAARLQHEGVSVVDGRVDLDRFGFSKFRSRRPLTGLRQLQEDAGGDIVLERYRRKPRFVAGVDLSYSTRERPDGVQACAAYAVVDARTLELVSSTIVTGTVRFPYIPGFLAFREAPLLRRVLNAVQRDNELADVILVDGNGILHPRGAGIASVMGLDTGARTIGVGKSLLCGQVHSADGPPEVPTPVTLQRRRIGYRIAATPQSRPIYVSPGHRIDCASAVRVVRSLFADHRLPEPIFHADRLSRERLRAIETADD